MTEPVRLTEMLGIAQGEVVSMADMIAKHREKNTRPENWFSQHERIFQHRKQVVTLIQNEIGRRTQDERKQA